MSADELVLCVDAPAVRALFDRHEPGCVWLPAEAASVDAWLAGVRKAFLPRDLAEQDPTWRHLATYACLTSGGKVFAYRRGKSGGESRLHDRWSIGVGGHVTLDDICRAIPPRFDAWSIYEAARRELDEEIDCHGRSWRFTDRHFAGLIADASGPVEAVHLGCVWHWDVADPASVSAREDCLADARWLSADDLWDLRDELEAWSRIVCRHVLRTIGIAD